MFASNITMDKKNLLLVLVLDELVRVSPIGSLEFIQNGAKKLKTSTEGWL